MDWGNSLMKYRSLLTYCLLTCTLLCGTAYSQESGAPDSVIMVITPPNAADAVPKMKAELYFKNDFNIVSASVGFNWVNENAVMTSAVVSTAAIAAFNLSQFVYRNNNIDSTNLYNQFLFNGARIFGNGLDTSSTKQLIATYNWNVPGWTVNDSIVIDTNAFSSGAIMKFVPLVGLSFKPSWGQRIVVRDVNWTEGRPPMTLRVPSEYATIQMAVDSSVNGDTILVADGIYNESVLIENRDLLLISVNGKVASSINRSQPDSGNALRIIDSSNLVIRGFSLYGEGIYGYEGGAIHLIRSELTLENCNVGGYARWYGGGLFMDASTVTLSEVLFNGCKSGRGTSRCFGGAISGSGTLIATECNFVDNIAEPTIPFSGGPQTGYGGAINFSGDSLILRQCSFTGNGAPFGSGSARTNRAESEQNKAVHPVVYDCQGGAISGGANIVRIDSCLFGNNEIYSNDGDGGGYGKRGGALNLNCGSLIIEGCIFENNSIAVYQGSSFLPFPGARGGAAFLNAANMILRDNVFNDNSCSATGGTFAGSSSIIDAKGGALFLSGNGLLENNSFIANRCSASSDGEFGYDSTAYFTVFAEGGTVYKNAGFEVRNCVFAANRTSATCGANESNLCSSSTSDFGPLSGYDSIFCNIFYDNMLVHNNDTNRMIIGELNPLFCDTANGDFTIKNSSPCAPGNNSCGVLIGAFGIGCQNLAPAVSSAISDTATEASLFVYHATSVDPDGPSATYSFINKPTWMASSVDSIYGSPVFPVADTSFTVIVSDGFLADTQVVSLAVLQVTPEVDSLLVDNIAANFNVIDHTPEFVWDYFDPTGVSPQTQVEFAVGTNNNWAFAEMWNPAPFISSDSFLIYNGSPLVDGATYYLRIRVYNGSQWSPWREEVFRMNSVPTIPALSSPVSNTIVGSSPSLIVTNSTDAESDLLVYGYEVYSDSALNTLVTSVNDIGQTPTSTSWAVDIVLTENSRYFWRSRVYDGYEYSGWSNSASFRVNGSPEAPASFSLIPLHSPGLPSFNFLPTLSWTAALDADPGDTVRYKLRLAIDQNFIFQSVKDSLLTPNFTVPDSLDFGTRYWWKVTAYDKTGLTTLSSPLVEDFWTWELGDVNHSHVTDISDLTAMIDYLFISLAPISPEFVADVDGDCVADIADLTRLIDYLFISLGPLDVGCE